MDFPIDPPKLKSLTSIFFGKKEKKQCMQGPPPAPLEPGLKTLTTTANHNHSLSCKKPNILSFSATSSSSSSLTSLSSPPSPTPSSASLMMDDVKEDNNDVKEDNAANPSGSANRHERRGEAEEEKKEVEEEKPTAEPQAIHRRRRTFHGEREFPPPIPLLARTGNLPCHMPWVLKRSYTDNCRLVIQEVKVKHHEYFRAHRANGRLTLQIIQLDESSTSLPLMPATPTEMVDEKTDEIPSTEMTRNKTDEISGKEMRTRETDKISPTETIHKKTEENSPSSTLSPSPPLCKNVKINAPEERSQVHQMSPSSLPPPPSMLSKELKNILDVNRRSPSKGNFRNWDDKNTRDVMEMGTLPSILSSSMPESSFGICCGNGGGGCCCHLNKRSNLLFSTHIPTIRPVRS